MSILSALGTALTSTADAGMDVLPLWFEGKQQEYLENKEDERKRLLAEENAKMTEAWLSPDGGKKFEFDSVEEMDKAAKVTKDVIGFLGVGGAQSTSINGLNGALGVSSKPQEHYELPDKEVKLPVSYDAQNRAIPEEQHYGVMVLNKYQGNSEAMFSDLKSAMAQVESGGRYDIKGPVLGSDSSHAGQQALGKYQIMPIHLPKIGLDPNKKEDVDTYMRSPFLQDQLFEAVLQESYQKAGGDPFWTSVYYYGAGDLDSKVPSAGGKTMPTRREHANKILEAMGLPAFYGSGVGPNGKPFSGANRPGSVMGNAESTIRAEVFGDKPKLINPQNEYVNKINNFLESPAYLNASPEARKNFMEQVIKPYQDAMKVQRDAEGDALSLYKTEIEQWGSNLRTYYNGEIRKSKEKGATAHRNQIGKVLTSIRTQIKRIDDFRKQYAAAKGTKKDDLIANFTEEYSKQEKTSNWFQDIFFDPKYEKAIDFDKMDMAYRKLLAEEEYYKNELMGVSGSTFSGFPEDVYVDDFNLTPPSNKYIKFKEE